MFFDTHLTLATEPLPIIPPITSLPPDIRDESWLVRLPSVLEDHEKNSEVKVEGRDIRHEGGQLTSRAGLFRGSVEVEGQTGSLSVERA